MKLTKGIPFEFHTIRGYIYGGPFKAFEPGTRRLVGVKMAEELDFIHDIDIPTRDYSVPDPQDMEDGMIEALQALHDGHDIYVGCMGGIGRTGLFMGCMTKLLIDLEALPEASDPVAYVRKHYIPHAIETSDQQTYVRTFDTTKVQAEAMRLVARPVQIVTQEVIKVMTPLEWLFPWAFPVK